MFITAFYGEVLILLLTIVTCARVFFIEHTRIDSIVLFAPLAFFISILQLFIWGFNFAELVLLYFSFYIFFINWRGFLRFCNHLYVDTYSILFKISSSIGLIFAIFLTVIFFLYRPIHIDAKKNNVNVQTVFYTKNFHGNFESAENRLAKKNMRLKIYSPSEKEKLNDFVILFVPDKRAIIDSYDSYLIELAKKGFTIYSADFNFSTIQRGVNRKIKFLNNFSLENVILPNAVLRYSLKKNSSENYLKYFFENPKYTYAYAKEFEILSEIVDKKELQSKKIGLLADEIPAQSFAKISKSIFARKIENSLSLNFLLDEEYKTKGFGFVEQSAPLDAKFYFDLNRDEKFLSPKIAATKTAIFFLGF